MAGVNFGPIRKRQEPLETAVKLQGPISDFPGRRGVQREIDTAHVADKQRIAGEDEPLIHQEADVFARMARRVKSSDAAVSDLQELSIGQGEM